MKRTGFQFVAIREIRVCCSICVHQCTSVVEQIDKPEAENHRPAAEESPEGNSRKATFRLRLRAGLAASNCFGGISPVSLPGVGYEPTCGFEPRLNQLKCRTIPANCQSRCLLIQILKLVRKPGFAPEPSPSQGEMLLLHHDPELVESW